MNEEAGSGLRGRFVVLTGGSSGIGRALASQLAERGASVLVGSRRQVGGALEHRPLDLACKASVVAFAGELVRSGRPIDLLILNAGVHVPWKRIETGDAEELHWQVNYLSNFLLVHLLLDLCSRSTLKRVVYVASEAHRLAALPGARLLGFWYRYARSKEAAVAFFLRLQELRRELTVRVISPGYVDSEIHRYKGALAERIERAWSRPRTPQGAAREILHASLAEGPPASVYWDRGAPARPSERCLLAARTEALWQASQAALRDELPEVSAPRPIRNFAGTFRALGPALARPTTMEQLSAVVRRAADSGRTVRVVGRCHSYNDSFYSRSCMVSLEHLDRVVRFDPAGGVIRCEGGITLGALCTYLDRRGFALRYCGNNGKQTLAGALATGTHGSGRDGGVMSELVRSVRLLLPSGQLIETSDERDLRALRLSLGTLGVLAEVTLAVERIRPCRYEVACLPRQEFVERLDTLARENEYLRFVPHPFDARCMFYVTINRLPDGAGTQPAQYVSDSDGGAARLLVPWLRVPAVRALIGRALRMGRHRHSLQVPFSSLLFIQSGVVWSHPDLARAGQLALDRPDWLNMELAIPRERYALFERLFNEERPRLSRLARHHPYYTCRVVGAADKALLANNHAREVVFVDLHADPADPSSPAFLRRLEAAAIATLSARPHWGKLFYSGRDTLRGLYPAANLAAFGEAKQRFDREGVFSNDYTQRVLGL